MPRGKNLTTAKPHIVILGAGLAGLGAAYRLAHNNLAEVTVVEQNNHVGGNAGSFEVLGIRVDYGSHRLHPACNREILSDIIELLGEDLLDRPRHGRIRLRSRWIHFPLKPIDLVFKLPPSLAIRSLADLVGKFLPNKRIPLNEQSFASVLEKGLGKTICSEFYLPYALKIWGMPPETLSVTQARRRVSAGSGSKMIKKILSGFKASSNDRFFYPKRGFGQIAESLYKVSHDLGVKFILGAKIDSIQLTKEGIKGVNYRKNGRVISTKVDHLWSTIPLPSLVKYFYPTPPQAILTAAESLRFRPMILIYLAIEQGQFSEYDAHYFPSQEIPITRLSEPKNYADLKGPDDMTVLCAELPCSLEAKEWVMSDAELGELVVDSLISAEIPLRTPIRKIACRRIKHAYPVYKRDYEKYFDEVDQWLSSFESLVSLGRQGLFAHDNVHHTLQMAYAAVDCLDRQGRFDRNRWQNHYRKIFETFTVED